jgi:hypothetical protein
LNDDEKRIKNRRKIVRCLAYKIEITNTVTHVFIWDWQYWFGDEYLLEFEFVDVDLIESVAYVCVCVFFCIIMCNLW